MSVVMNLFAATEKIVLFCGLRCLHLCNLKRENEPHIISWTLTDFLNAEEKMNLQNLSLVCCCVSRCSTYVAASDSEKNIFMFKKNGEDWKHFHSWKVDKRVVKLQFDKNTTTVIMTDKTGDVYISHVEATSMSPCKKILGHCSLILDTVVTEDNSRIFTCDRDEKIRISLFPDAYEIHDFLLGHQAAVVNVAMVCKDTLVVSASCDGILKIWTTADSVCIATWDVIEILYGSNSEAGVDKEKPPDFELIRMRVSDNKSSVALIIAGHHSIPILHIDFENMKCRLICQVAKSSNFCDVAWVEDKLLVFSPGNATIHSYILEKNDCIKDPESSVSLTDKEDIKTDLSGYENFHKCYASLKKLVWVDKSKPIESDSVKITRRKGLELEQRISVS